MLQYAIKKRNEVYVCKQEYEIYDKKTKVDKNKINLVSFKRNNI